MALSEAPSDARSTSRSGVPSPRVNGADPAELSLSDRYRLLRIATVCERDALVRRRVLLLAEREANAHAAALGAVRVRRDERADRPRATSVPPAAVVAHELRSSLAVIALSAANLRTALKDAPDNGDTGGWLAHLESAVGEANELVGQVLNYAAASAPVAGSSSLVGQQCDLVAVVRSVVASRLAGSTRQIVVSVPERLSVAADEVAVRLVLLNLLGNAVKHSPEDSALEIIVEAATDRARVLVVNEGRPLAPSEVSGLFRPWSRLTSAVAPGFGIGLHIALAAAREQGGDLRYRPYEGSGNCFVLELPYGRTGALVSAGSTRNAAPVPP